jgi:ribosomal protein L16 Arg81 hydroxylase
MRSDRSPLGGLLGRLSLEAFLRVHWERRPLLVKGSSRDGFHGLLSMEAMDEILSSGHVRYPECRLVKDGRMIPVDRYVIGDPARGLIDVDSLYAHYRDKATITLTSLHRYWRPLAVFCRGLEAVFSHPFQANAYLTRRGSQGFAPHFDTHEVFVLQVEGRKEWRLYDHPVPLPGDSLPPQPAVPAEARVCRSLTLRAGDLLYIPRGHVHDANAADADSLHITIGVLGATWGDALAEAVNSLVRADPAFRRLLPVGFAGKARMPADLRGAVARMQARAAAGLRLAEAVRGTGERFLSERPHFPDGRLLELAQDNRLALGTIVARREGGPFTVRREGRKVSLLLYRRKVRFPAFVGPALAFVRSGRRFRLSELPGRLSDPSKLVLGRCLLREGVLRVVPKPGRGPGIRAA